MKKEWEEIRNEKGRESEKQRGKKGERQKGTMEGMEKEGGKGAKQEQRREKNTKKTEASLLNAEFSKQALKYLQTATLHWLTSFCGLSCGLICSH